MTISKERFNELYDLCGQRVLDILADAGNARAMFAVVSEGSELAAIATDCGVTVGDVKNFALALIARSQECIAQAVSS